LTNAFIFSAIKYALLFVPPIFAILFNEIPTVRYRKIVQTMTTLPHFISWVIVYGLVYALFSTEGVVNKALVTFGLPTQKVMTDRNAVYTFQSVLYLWKVLGWNSIIYVAAIAGIDPQLYEAASIDGAGHFKRALPITLPGILPTMLVLLLLGVANIISNGMDQYYLFQNPMNYNKIETLELYTYKQGMKLMDYSYASAVDIMKSVVSLTLLFVTNAIAKKIRGSAIV
jgi:ABC-type polysaccharide transport system permease subunit